MSYGVIASKSANIMVETTAGIGSVASDVALDRFQDVWGPSWVAGRVTLTKLHLNFIPNRAGRGMAMLDLKLREIETVEIGGGRVSRVMTLRTPTHLVHVRAIGAPALAQQAAELIDAAKTLPLRKR